MLPDRVSVPEDALARTVCHPTRIAVHVRQVGSVLGCTGAPRPQQHGMPSPTAASSAAASVCGLPGPRCCAPAGRERLSLPQASPLSVSTCPECFLAVPPPTIPKTLMRKQVLVVDVW